MSQLILSCIYTFYFLGDANITESAERPTSGIFGENLVNWKQSIPRASVAYVCNLSVNMSRVRGGAGKSMEISFRSRKQCSASSSCLAGRVRDQVPAVRRRPSVSIQTCFSFSKQVGAICWEWAKLSVPRRHTIHS